MSQKKSIKIKNPKASAAILAVSMEHSEKGQAMDRPALTATTRERGALRAATILYSMREAKWEH